MDRASYFRTNRHLKLMHFGTSSNLCIILWKLNTTYVGIMLDALKISFLDIYGNLLLWPLVYLFGKKCTNFIQDLLTHLVLEKVVFLASHCCKSSGTFQVCVCVY